MPELTPLKYKTYTWPYNPETYKINFEKNTVVHSYPGMNVSEIDDLGMKPREVSGSGEFIGEGAYEEFKKLASIFYNKGPGALIHPIWQIQQAIFTRLEVEQEPTPNYVKYSFSFIEHFPEHIINSVGNVETVQVQASESSTESQATVSNKTYTVKKGDSMWKIAQNNKMSLDNLVKKNPQIKNPSLIYPGQNINL